jgi:hypothetical protein
LTIVKAVPRPTLRIISDSKSGGFVVATETEGESSQNAARATDQDPVPFMQRVLDNPFLLLFLGVAVPAVFYLMWGLMELTQVPIAQ